MLFNKSKCLAAALKDKMLICGLHLIGGQYLSPEIPVSSLVPCYLTQEDRDSSKVAYSLALCENNSIYVQDTRKNGHVYCTVFPPPTAQQIISVHFSMKMNRIIVFLVSGSLCHYQYDTGETALLEKIQNLNSLRDCEGKVATTS